MNNQKYAALVDKLKYSFPWLFCFFMTYVSSFILSGGSAPTVDLDQSYQVVLEYARTHNFQFGQDIVFTFGPLGFLNNWVSQGLFPTERIIFALAWSGIVAWSATGLVRQIPGRMKFVFLMWFLFYSNLGWLEQHAFMVMAYGCMILMDDIHRRKGAAATFLTVFAVLALIKFTFFIVAIISVILCVLVQIGRRDFRSSLAILLCFVSVFLAIWLAEGQKLENLFSWVRGSSEIAGGFTDAMTIVPENKVLVTSAVAGAMFLASLLIVIRSARLSLRNVGILLVTTAYVFIAWKHGFVRADGHVIFFIFFLPIAFAILLTEDFQISINNKLRLYMTALFLSVVILCNWAADFQDPGTMLTKLIDWPGNMAGNSRRILKCITGDWKYQFEALRENKKLKQESDLPITRTIVGKNSIDVINYRQWAALANNLNYRPRPVIQGYSAYTPYLQDLNLSYYQSEKRPQYLLLKMETIDNRFPTLDDATLLPYILGNYKPIAKEGDFIVLQASPNIPSIVKMSMIHEQTVTFGESLNLPLCGKELLIMQVEVKPTLIGRAIKFFFQAPILTFNTKTNGKAVGYRFIPAMAERGFIVSPLLLTNNDVMHYYDDVTFNCAESISFSKPEYNLGQISSDITVKLYKLINSDRGI
jgi:hypothetical protein